MMKKLLFPALVALAGSLALPAYGQVVVQPGIFPHPLALVENKDVQKDIQLSEEQIKQIAELGRRHAERLRGLGFQEVDKRKKVVEATQKGLSDVLSAEQSKRIKQLEVQQRGAGIFLDPQLAKDLALSKEQQAAVAKALQGFGPKWIAIIQAAKGNQQEIQKKLGEVNSGLVADILKDLSADQRAKWTEMNGPAFAGMLPAVIPNLVFANPRPQPVLQWHMNDLAAAQVEARQTGKPIFVTFRCEA
jgi:hypothetical protein